MLTAVRKMGARLTECCLKWVLSGRVDLLACGNCCVPEWIEIASDGGLKHGWVM